MKRILLVEDERLIALSETRMLEKHGFLVETAHSGESAARRVRTGRVPDLILMDIDLGDGMDGTETARHILSHAELPIVFLTGHAEREMVDRVKGITRYGYVLKGSGEFVLIESINMAFELFRAHREITAKERRLEELIEGAPVGIFQSWASGAFATVNAEVARTLGFASPAVAVSHYEDLATQLYADSDRREELLARLESEGEVRGFDLEAVGVDGRMLNLRLDAQVFERHENDFLISGFVVDETSRKTAERARRKSETDYRRIVNLAQEIIERVDKEGRWTFLNDAACAFWGASREELIGRRFLDYVHPDDRVRAIAAGRHSEAERTPAIGVTTRQWTPRGWREVRWNSAPILDERGRCTGHQASGWDTTELRAAETALRESEAKYRLLAENSSDVVTVLDAQLKPTYASPATERHYGYGMEDLAGRGPLYPVHPEDAARVEREIRSDIAEGAVEGVHEFRVYTRSGVLKWVESRARYLYDSSGSFEQVVANIRDTTDRRAVEERLRAALEEKELLWTELNHRVKNNLNIVASLISVKDSTLGETADLSDVSSQVRAISHIHERLSKSGGVSRVNIASYLKDILSELFTVYNQAQVQPDIVTHDLTLPTRVATDLGLIITELATNAVKHGFQSERKPRFWVYLEKEPGEDECELVVGNTGKPFPPDVQLDGSASLGLQLVSAWVRKMGGRISLQREPYPVFTIRFPVQADTS